MTSLEFKYLISACLTLTGNTYIFLQGVKGDHRQAAGAITSAARPREALYRRRSWPFQLWVTR